MKALLTAVSLALGASPVCSPASLAGMQSGAPASAPDPESLDALAAALDLVLARGVHGDRVDYSALQAELTTLRDWTRLAGEVPPDSLSTAPRADQIAFWINAYNAWTLQSVLEHQPLEKLPRITPDAPARSIRQIPDVWQAPHRVAGQSVSLDDVENQILRARFREPRIHFAINCASVGCPPLRNEAFRGSRLDAQLDEQARSFLRAPHRNQIDPATGTVKLSRIFEWFGEDFGGPEAFHVARPSPAAVLRFIARYVPEESRKLVQDFDPDRVAYLDYDWSLNAVSGTP